MNTSFKKSIDKRNGGQCIRYISNNKNIELEQLADIFKALSNPNRLKIFLRLATCCRPGTVGIYDQDADVAALRPLPAALRQDGRMHCACIGGAAPIADLHGILQSAGFERTRITPPDAKP